MGASHCLTDAWVLRKAEPLVLRYLLYAHSGGADAARAEPVFQDFARLPAYQVSKSKRRHEFWAIERVG